MIKHLLSIANIDTETLACLVERSVAFASGSCDGCRSLSDKIVGIYFSKPSTRTRTSFTVGAMKLGAQTIAYGRNDLQITTGETIENTARVLSGYLNALVIRTNDDIAEMRVLADQGDMAVINAMSRNEHPTQAIADLSVVKETFQRLDGLHLLYLGEGNNTAAALALAVALSPKMRITFITPKAYGLPTSILEQAAHLARRTGSVIEQHHNINNLPKHVDAVYTTRWQTMGEPRHDPDWRDQFSPYSVTSSLMTKVSKPSGTIFLHDLPTVLGEEVQSEVFNSPNSRVWRQARYKMFSAMAILEWCLKGSG